MKAAFAQFLNLRHGGTGLLLQRQPRAAVPFAQLPRHQLHGHAAGHAAAGRHHLQPRSKWLQQRDLHGRPGSAEPLHLPAGADEHRADGRRQHGLCPWHALQWSHDQRHLAHADPGAAAVPDSRCLQHGARPPRRRRHHHPPRLRRSATPATPATRSSTSSQATSEALAPWGRCGSTHVTTSTTATRISSGRVIPTGSRPQPGIPGLRTMARIPTTASTLTGGRR